MSTSEATYRDWANMPNDILYTISSKLFTREYLSFNKVCTSWRAARAPSTMPRLLYIPKPDDNSEQPKQLTLSTDISNNDNISDSSLCSPYLHDMWRCIGSQDGWLIIVVRNGIVVLFNPVKAQQIYLPNIDFPFYTKKAIIVWPCQTDDEPIVVLLIDYHAKPIAFARISDSKWYYRSKSNSYGYRHICCIGRKVFVLDLCRHLYAIKINKSSYLAVEIKSKNSSLVSGVDSFMFTNCIANYSDMVSLGNPLFMVKFGRDILVVRTLCHDGNLYKFAIEKYDLEKQKWSWLRDLGGCSLFLGELCSVSVSAEENFGRKGNMIYFQGWHEWKENEYTIGVFDMDDGSYKTIKLSDMLSSGSISLHGLHPLISI